MVARFDPKSKPPGASPALFQSPWPAQPRFFDIYIFQQYAIIINYNWVNCGKEGLRVNQENQLFLRICSIVTDAALVVLAMLLAYLVRFRLLPGIVSMPLIYYIRCSLLLSLLYLLLFATLGFYESKKEVLILHLIQRIILVSLGCTVVLATLFFASRSIDASRWLLVLFFLFSTVLLSAKQVLVHRYLRRSYRKGQRVRSVLLVGSGRSAAEYARTLKEMPWLGYQVLGTLGAKPLDGEEYLGPLSAVEGVLQDTTAVELVAALDADELPEMDRLVRLTEKNGLKFSLIPYFAPYMISRPHIDQVGSLPLINMRRIPLDNMLNSALKRLFDIVGSLLLILLTSPVMLFTAAVTRLTLGKPVIFRQVRVGYQRREFTMLKFRSMREERPTDKGGWSTYDRNRVTPFGAFIRKTSIDELPQLFNVLRGDMSLVGPRPELPRYVDSFRETVPLYMLKHQVRPGMTGLAQVNGYRGDTSIEGRIRLDIRYIETWSFLLDVSILLRTFFHFMNNGENTTHEKNQD